MKPLWPGSKRPAASTVVLEVAPRAAKVVVATGTPPQIQRLNATTLPEHAGDSAAAVRALLDAQPLGVRELGVLFGRELFSLRTLELPSTDTKEIASMLELQLGKLTPYPRAEILSAWTVIGSFRQGYTSVLLAIARKALIQDVLQVLKAKSMTPQWVGVSTEGLEAWWAASKMPRAGEASDQLSVLIDVDFASTDCAVLSTEGQVLFTHSIAIGCDQMKAAEASTLRWVGELVRLPRILSHEGVNGRIGRGVLTGVTQHLESAVEQLTSQWGVPVEVKPSLGPVTLAPGLVERAAVTGVAFTALAGVLVSARLPRIDLMPQETRVSQALRVRSRHLARLSGSLAAALVLGILLYVERIIIWRHYLAQLHQQLAATQDVSQQVIERRHAMQQIRGWLDPSRGPLEVFRAIAEATQPPITITQVTMEEGRPVIIRGRSETMGGAFEFFDRLKQQKLFASVQPRSVAKAKVVADAGAEFELICELPTS